MGNKVNVTKADLAARVRELEKLTGMRFILASGFNRVTHSQVLYSDLREFSPELTRINLALWLDAVQIGFGLGFRACARLQPDK